MFVLPFMVNKDVHKYRWWMEFYQTLNDDVVKANDKQIRV